MNQEYLYILNNFWPEVILTVVGLLVLTADLLLPKGNQRRTLTIIAAMGCLVAALWAVVHWLQPAYNSPYALSHFIGGLQSPATPLFTHPAYAVSWLFGLDKFADAFKVIFSLAAFLVLLLSVRFPVEKYRGEFAALLLFATVGLMVMANARDLIVIFIGLELASLCLYALAAWHKNDARSAESGTKYLLLGSLASAFFIYGASLLFVKFGSTNLMDISDPAKLAGPLPPIVIVGMLMLIVGFGFKVAAVPFHFWAPDVYQGAPTPVVAFLSTASKAAGFAVLIRVLGLGFPLLSGQWGVLLAVMAGLSVLVGNLVAVHQNNVKRLLAYSGIAQAGYLLIGVMALGMAHPGNSVGAILGVKAVILYLFLYMVGNIGAFAITGIVAKESGSEEMRAFAGLRTRAPMLAFAMLLLLLSLGGIPLLAGFVGKWFLFMSGIQVGQYVVVFLAAIMNVVSIYYYLLIAKQMYILPADETALPIRVGGAATAGLFIVVGMTLLIGVFPGPFLYLAEQAARSLFG